MYIRDCLRVCHNVRWLLPIQTSSVEIPIVAALCIDANWYFPQVFAVNTLKIHNSLQRLHGLGYENRCISNMYHSQLH